MRGPLAVCESQGSTWREVISEEQTRTCAPGGQSARSRAELAWVSVMLVTLMLLAVGSPEGGARHLEADEEGEASRVYAHAPDA